MTKRVIWSKTSVFITVMTFAILFVGIICYRHNEAKFYTLSAIVVVMLILMWYYSPVTIDVDDNDIVIKRRICNKIIPISSIESISSFTPMPFLRNQRVCGSGGFAGFWGWFTDQQIGTYFAYHGNNSDCFLIQLTNGRQYVLGCEDSRSVVSFISDKIKK